MLKSGYKARNRGALLVDVVKDTTGKYVDPEGYVAEPERAKANLKAASVAQRMQAEEAQLNAKLAEEFLALERGEQAARALTQVRMFVGRELSEETLRGLLKAMQAGNIEPYDVYREVTKAASELRLGDFAHDLREAYG